MKETILYEFLLFDLPRVVKYNQTIIELSKASVIAVFVFALFFDLISDRPNPGKILKQALIVQFVLIFLPKFYFPVASFGLTVGDALLKEKRSGIVANWRKIKREVSRETKDPSISKTFFAFFKFKGVDYVEKAAVLVISICILLLKVIYSVVFYGTYLTIAIRSVISIFSPYHGNLKGILGSILYLIVTAIVVAIALYFLNDLLDFDSSKEGFVFSLSGIANFFVLAVILLGSLKIGKDLVNGGGIESWGAQMGSVISGGLMYKSMGLASYPGNQIKNAASNTGRSALKIASKSALFSAKALAAPMSVPAMAAGYGLKKAVGEKAKLLSMEKGTSLNQSNDQLSFHSSTRSLNANRGPISWSKSSYERGLDSIREKGSVKSALNPSNHFKASRFAISNSSKEFKNNLESRLGIPSTSKSLTLKEKSLFVANNFLNPKERKIDLKDQILAMRINDRFKGRRK